MTPHNRHAGGRAAPTRSRMHYPIGIVFCLGWWLLAATSRTTCACAEKLRLGRVLSRKPCLTFIVYPGDAVAPSMPTLVWMLGGATPANTAAIRVDVVPGSTSRYSGGGYTVMQQMMIDVTGK